MPLLGGSVWTEPQIIAHAVVMYLNKPFYRKYLHQPIQALASAGAGLACNVHLEDSRRIVDPVHHELARGASND